MAVAPVTSLYSGENQAGKYPEAWVKKVSSYRWNWRGFRRGFWAAVIGGLFLIGVRSPRPDQTSEDFHSLAIARDHLFDFVDWEVSAFSDKLSTGALGPQIFMTEHERSQLVRDYFALVGEISRLEDEVEALYASPDISNPDAASLPLRQQRDVLRARQSDQQALVEAIIQEQISEILVEHGFGIGGQVIPPVQMRFTQLPTLLVLSPRDHIERTGSYPLEHGLTVERQEQIEADVASSLGTSSLIVPLGGLAVYPAMMIETSNLAFAFEVAAHEWSHHYLTFFPLGVSYGTTPELYTMNETAANIVGKEVGWEVLTRYYPDLAPPPPDYTPQPAEVAPAPGPSEAPTFDFRAEMHQTRVHVDELLAQGRIAEAEAYMEARRRVFLENGYRIRKINQAYFAFYGSYADVPGYGGTDPIGPAIRELRYYSHSLTDFVNRVRGITTVAELNAALAIARQGSSDG